MSSSPKKQFSNPFSIRGEDLNFENRILASFAVLMITRGSQHGALTKKAVEE